MVSNDDLWPKVNNFNGVWTSVISSQLAKTASKLVHSFGWNFVHKKRAGHTHTDTQTICSENITPPRFRGGVKLKLIIVHFPLRCNYVEFAGRPRCFQVSGLVSFSVPLAHSCVLSLCVISAFIPIMRLVSAFLTQLALSFFPCFALPWLNCFKRTFLADKQEGMVLKDIHFSCILRNPIRRV